MSNQSEKNNLLVLVDSLSAPTEDKLKVKLAIEKLVNKQENRLEAAIDILNKFSNFGTCQIEYVIREGARNRAKFSEFIELSNDGTQSEIYPLARIFEHLFTEFDSID